jgi:Putative metallopeptidase
MKRLALSCALLLIGPGAEPLLAQSVRPVAPSSRVFQAGIEAAARLAADQPHFKRLSPQQRQAHVEFVFGNILFVAAHELGHALISEMKLPILGREEDAADVFAIVVALQIGDHLSHRVLEEAAKGWFLAARRDKREGQALGYYERHGLNEQRAYQIVCLMVGSDPVKFKTLADETKLPQDRRRTCVWDYESAVGSWDSVLARHRRAADQPPTHIDFSYGEGKGVLALPERIFRTTRFLETVAEHIGERYVWPARIEFEMRTCGHANARWTIPLRQLHICYELVREFAELYRDHGPHQLRPRRRK